MQGTFGVAFAILSFRQAEINPAAYRRLFMSDSDANTNPRFRWLMVASIVVGLTAASYMTFESLSFLQNGDTGHRLCSFSTRINCDASVTSPYAFVQGMPGVPIAWVAFLFFVSIAGLLSVARWLPKCAFVASATLAVLCVMAASVSAWMFMILIFKLKTICLPCMSIQIASYCLCAISILSLRGFLRSVRWSSVVVLFMGVQAFYGGGLAALLNFETNHLEPKPVDVAREVNRYLVEPAKLDPSLLPSALGKSTGDKIQILCFIDFQCPECRKTASLLPGWLGNLKDKCRIIHRQFPLDAAVNPYKPNGMHTQAGLAAKAAISFHRLGISEPLEQRMFKNQRSLSLQTIFNLAAAANVNTNSLFQMMESAETRDALAHDIELAHASGVSATPTLFIDGRQVTLYYEPEVLRGIVTAELARQEPQRSLGKLDN